MASFYRKKHDDLVKALEKVRGARFDCCCVAIQERTHGDSEHADVFYRGVLVVQLDTIIAELRGEIDALLPMIEMEEQPFRSEEITKPDLRASSKPPKSIK